MKRLTRGSAFLVLASACLLSALSSCRNPLAPANRAGSGTGVRLVFDSAGTSRTIAADFPAAISTYRVLVYAHGSATASSEEILPKAATFLALAPGTWDLGFEALGSDGLAIGEARVEGLVVVQGETRTLTVKISPSLSGSGSYCLVVRFPSGLGIDYLSGQLSQDGSAIGALMLPAIVTAVDPLTGIESSSATFGPAPRAAGNYELLLSFRRGGPSGALVLSLSEGLNIRGNLSADHWLDPEGSLRAEMLLTEGDFKSGSTMLAGLSLMSGGAKANPSPAFSSDTRAYSLDIDAALSLSALAAAPGQAISYKIDGGASTTIMSREVSASRELEPGQHTLTVSVVPADGSASGSYTVDLAVRPTAPTISVASGVRIGFFSVALAGPSGAQIRYTIDGQDPTAASSLYSSALTISETTTLKAIVVQSTFVSAVAAATYAFISEPALVEVGGGSYHSQLGSGGADFSLDAFRIGKYEVTKELYSYVMSGGAPASGPTLAQGEVSWYDAIVFCNRLSAIQGLEPVYRVGGSFDQESWGEQPALTEEPWEVTMVRSASGYRLPTSCEWQFAALGGPDHCGDYYFYSGGNAADDVAWDNGNASSAHPVGDQSVAVPKPPNQLHLYDMSGNVAEWCWDEVAPAISSAQRDPAPLITRANMRINRGGGFGSPGTSCAIAEYSLEWAINRSLTVGLRLVRGPVPATTAVGGILISAAKARALAGEPFDLAAELVPYYASNKGISWSSSDGVVASVDAAGRVTPRSGGKATVTATSSEGGYTASCVLTVLGTTQSTRNLSANIDMVGVHSSSYISSTYPSYSQRRPAYQIGVTEVTVAQYNAVMGTALTGDLSLPVAGVSWITAIKFCNRLSIKEGLGPVYTLVYDNGSGKTYTGSDPDVWETSYGDLYSYGNFTADPSADGYRLPSGDEWFYAAKGAAETAAHLYAGSDSLDDVAWHSGNADGHSHPVKGKLPNELGLYDMSGNVGELIWSESMSMAHYRGGSYSLGYCSLDANDWSNITADEYQDYVGFRVAR
jgi:formylglycine-generating enzyme